MSMWDTLALYLALDAPAIVLKRELLRIPFYGWFLWKATAIAIDRAAGAGALRKMAAAARDVLAEGRPILIFPEGTRKKPGAAPDYKPGVAGLYTMLDVACVPVALNSGVYWTGFIKQPGTIVLEFLEPIAPGLKRDAFMALLESRIETATNQLAAMTALGQTPCGPCTVCCIELKIDTPQLRKEARVPCPHLSARGLRHLCRRARRSASNSSAAGGCSRRWAMTGARTSAACWRCAGRPAELPAAWQDRALWRASGGHWRRSGGDAPRLRRYVGQAAGARHSRLPVGRLALHPAQRSSGPAGADASVVQSSGWPSFMPCCMPPVSGRACWKGCVFLYRLQIDRQRQKYLGKSTV